LESSCRAEPQDNYPQVAPHNPARWLDATSHSPPSLLKPFLGTRSGGQSREAIPVASVKVV